MRKAIRLAVLVWCAVALGRIAHAAQPLAEAHSDADALLAFDNQPFVHVGLLAPDAHQQLLILLGQQTFNVTQPLMPAVDSLDVSYVAPRRIPEPSMFALFTLAGAALMGRRRQRRGPGRSHSRGRLIFNTEDTEFTDR